MNIAMLSVHSCPLGRLGEKNTGGMSVCLREIARELGKRGHRVDIYTRAHGSMHERIIDFSPHARVIHLKAGQDEEIDKLAIYPHLADFVSELERFRTEKGLHYDLIHSHYWLSAWAGKTLCPAWKVAHIATFHTVAAAKDRTGIGEPEPPLRLRTEAELVRSCHRIVASTDRERKDLIHHYHADPRAIEVIPCGVNLDLFRPIDKGLASQYLDLRGKDFILYVGRLDPLKGLENLIEALALLDGLRVELVVVGGGQESQPHLDRLRDLSRRLHVEDSVTFYGLAKQEILPYFYSAARACVIPSYYETFGLVTLESLACGTPVVATPVGCVEHVVRHGVTGYVVAANTPRLLADNMARVLLSSNGELAPPRLIRGSVARFGWPQIADAMEREYRSVWSSDGSVS